MKLDLEKLAAILDQLGKDRRAPARAAAMVHEAGTSWRALLGLDRATPPSHWSRCRDLLGKPDKLTAWERDFLTGCAGFFSLSPKQAALIDGIAHRAQLEAAP